MKRKKLSVKRYILFFFIITVITALTSMVAAKYIRNSIKLNNTFTPAESVIPEIKETFVNNVKKNVSFNVGNTEYPVYVRAKILVNWTDKDGTVFFSAPAPETDYELDLNLSQTSWIDGGDGYYYHCSIVQSGESTADLIKKCEPKNVAPDPDFDLNVNIIVQTIQAIGYTDDDKQQAVQNAWNWTPPAA